MYCEILYVDSAEQDSEFDSKCKKTENRHSAQLLFFLRFANLSCTLMSLINLQILFQFNHLLLQGPIHS